MRDAHKPSFDDCNAIINDIYNEHVEGAKILGPKQRENLTLVFKKECNDLRTLLSHIHEQHGVPEDGSIADGLRPTNPANERDSKAEEEKDRAIGVGEKLSAQFVAALLEDNGVPSTYVDLSDVIQPIGHRGLDESFIRELSDIVQREVANCGSRVPVSINSSQHSLY